MCAERSRRDIVEDIRLQLVEYAEFRQRMGDAMTYRKALMDHRDQCMDCLRDDPNGPWQERLSWLNELVREEGL